MRPHGVHLAVPPPVDCLATRGPLSGFPGLRVQGSWCRDSDLLFPSYSVSLSTSLCFRRGSSSSLELKQQQPAPAGEGERERSQSQREREKEARETRRRGGEIGSRIARERASERVSARAAGYFGTRKKRPTHTHTSLSPFDAVLPAPLPSSLARQLMLRAPPVPPMPPLPLSLAPSLTGCRGRESRASYTRGSLLPLSLSLAPTQFTGTRLPSLALLVSCVSLAASPDERRSPPSHARFPSQVGCESSRVSCVC